MRTRAALTVAGWLAGATVAVLGVTFAMSTLGHDLLDSGDPMTAAQVQQQLAQSGQAGAKVADPAAPRTTANGATAQQFTSGIVSATCAAGQASLFTWSAAQGFHVARVQAGPATAASIDFASSASSVLVTVTCVGNVPHFASTAGSATAAATGAGAGAGGAGAGGVPDDQGGGARRGGGGGTGSGRGGGPGASGVIIPGDGDGDGG